MVMCNLITFYKRARGARNIKIERIDFAARKPPRRQEGKTTSRLTARFLSAAGLQKIRNYILKWLETSLFGAVTLTSQAPKGAFGEHFIFVTFVVLTSRSKVNKNGGYKIGAFFFWRASCVAKQQKE